MAFDATDFQPAQATKGRPVRDTCRINMLAGCTVLGRQLADTKVGLKSAIAAHRRAQIAAAKPYKALGLKPAQTRQHVRKVVADIRRIEAAVEAKYGALVPVRGAV